MGLSGSLAVQPVSWAGASAAAELITLQVTDVQREAERIRSFELRDPTGAALPPFQAGAHIQVEVGLPDGSTALRQYSLLGDQRDRNRYRIAVLLEPEGRGGSRFMHEHVGTGATLRATRPELSLPLSRDAGRHLLIAGGIGVTPILSMARELATRGDRFELHYAARGPAQMAFRREVENIAGPVARFYFSRGPDPVPLDLRALLAAPAPDAHVYVCGPPRMIRAVRTLGEEAGWAPGRIHFESFGPRKRPEDRPIEVRLERSGLCLRVPPGETILDALLGAGVWAPYECRRGSCGSCMTRVLDGEPDHRDAFLTDDLRREYVCTCVSRAVTEHLSLDL